MPINEQIRICVISILQIAAFLTFSVGSFEGGSLPVGHVPSPGIVLMREAKDVLAFPVMTFGLPLVKKIGRKSNGGIFALLALFGGVALNGLIWGLAIFFGLDFVKDRISRDAGRA